MTAGPSTIDSLNVEGVPLRIARPTAGATTGVVVLHQGPGYAPHTVEWLQRLADDGHLVVAPLLLHHRGEEAVDPFTRFDGDLAAFAAFLPGDDEVRSDITAALNYLSSCGISAQRTAIIGFSFGGRAAFLAAIERNVGGVVTFYGNGIAFDGYAGNEAIPALSERIPQLQNPWLGLYGDRDFLLADGELDEFEILLRGASTHTELVRYAGAGHAFDADMIFAPGAPSSLDPDTARDAIERTRAFLETHLRQSGEVRGWQAEPSSAPRRLV